MKKIWVFVAISGALTIIMGALSAHLFKGLLTNADVIRIQTAATYQMYHTLVLLILAVYHSSSAISAIQQSCWLFAMGIVLFSGSLYVYTFSDIQLLVFVTPIGGLLLILGWLSLIKLVKQSNF